MFNSNVNLNKRNRIEIIHMTSLKDELVGSWKLLSYIEVPIIGEDSVFPMGKSPSGILTHSSDGYMSLQIAKEKNQLFKDNREERREIMKDKANYSAFCAKYTVDLKNAIVTYDIESPRSLNEVNKIQHKRVNFEGDIMYLKSTEPVLSNGVEVNSYMTWERIPNSDTFTVNLENRYTEV